MINRIVRRGLLLAAMGTAVAAAPATATHNGTCNGFEDPNCNLNYFYQHQGDQLVDLARPVLEVIFDAQNLVLYTVNEVSCQYLGAC